MAARAKKKAFELGKFSTRYTFHDIRAKSLSDARALEEPRVPANHSDSRITQAVYRRLPETATVMDIGHLKSKNIRHFDFRVRVKPYKTGAPGRNRTCDLALRRHSLYPLSYRGRRGKGRKPVLPAFDLVEEKGIEPSTFALRTRRSPN